MLEGEVSRFRGTPALLVDDVEAGIVESGQNVGGVIGCAVVDKDHLEIVMSLLEDRTQGLFDVGPGIVARDETLTRGLGIRGFGWKRETGKPVAV